MTKESPSAISWIGSVDGLLVIATGIIAGRLYDKGYLYHILYGGSVLITFSLFMLSLSQPNSLYQNFLAQGIGHGLGAGLMYVPSLAVISQYFRRRRALAMSIVASGSSLGAIIHPIMLNNLFVRIGFGNAVRASAGMNAGLLIIACLLIRPRLPPSTNVPAYWTSVKKFSKDKPYVCAALGLMVFPIGMYFPLFFLQLDAAKRGLSVNFAFYSLVILNGASFVGRLSPGFITKYIPIQPLTAITTGACAVLLYAVSGITTVPAFVVFGILYGILSGIFISLMAPLISTLCDDYSELGRVCVVLDLWGHIDDVKCYLGPPVEGALLGDSFEWWKAAVFAGSLAVFGSFMFGSMVYFHRRK
ncbi:hypothetical protein AGABI1DRAFT_65844 [Agaricus bisporus var. burnettii JB137-S8]|uniref:Major facilitator superfamily (MFS) profile domain-containing protein n=1 Tax=Agaricus bisporus var. burnettii (strain JB137-S8 / ATCC MYA-4627 / FGSC 10392) TaxID=597362 RepID=K5XJ30_AGABU|nr:uncharacterized protein AGABI1DRAFT_65844 [Agaricus bisporus var. burnettii JB137-S8]EKM83347.1 hypothetical protein AGABI1DRAFT_65844 [Agaricus bisporus var. burnettii JB137-S8]